MREARGVLDTCGDPPVEDPRSGQRGAVLMEWAKKII